MIDPTTGLPRIIFGDDQGIWSRPGRQRDARVPRSGPRMPWPANSRNGNLQITQFYYGAAQPSNAAALIAGALFYGSAQDNGGPCSDPNVINNGDIVWNGPGGDASGVATDQQGNGTLYQYFWPCCGGGDTDFFQVNGVGETYGLLQASDGDPTPDPQWPLPRRRQLRRQPGQWPGHRHQLGRRPDLHHHQRGRELVRHRRPGGLRQPRQLQRRPGLRCARPDGPRGRRQPGQFHLRRYRDRDRSTSPRTAAAAAPATTGSISPPGWTARPSSRSSPTRPAAATTPTPSPTRASTTSPTRSPRRATRPRPGSTSPATSRPWPTPSSARATTRRPTPIAEYDLAVTLSSIAADWRYAIPNDDQTQGDQPRPVRRRRFGRVSVDQRWPDVDALPRYELRRGGGGRLSAACLRHLAEPLAGRHQPRHGRPTLDGPDAPCLVTGT